MRGPDSSMLEARGPVPVVPPLHATVNLYLLACPVLLSERLYALFICLNRFKDKGFGNFVRLQLKLVLFSGFLQNKSFCHLKKIKDT